jgi:limonene-1,2-epoxide hydrolase
MHSIHRLTRRALLVVATLGALAAAGAPSAALAGPTEKANEKVVDAFMAAWNDPDEAVTFLAPNASVRMVEDQPAVVGQANVAAALKSFMKPGVTVSVKTLKTESHGPVVMNQRIDTLKEPGKPDQVYKLVGVFVVKDGKIVEWADYLEQ